MKTPAIQRSLRFRASGLLKSVVYGAYRLPFSRFGLEPGLVPFLPPGVPVTLIDIGAANGEFTAAVVDHCGLRRALLIEPQPEFAKALRSRFDDPRVAIQQCAVSDHCGSVSFDILNAPCSSSVLHAIPSAGGAGKRLDLSVRERVTVQTRRLDDLLADTGTIGDIDLMKIDTQGAELQVLRGATGTLARVRIIWVEVSFVRLYEGSALFADVHAFMKQHGFRLYSLHDGFRGSDGELLQADALFLGPAVETAVS